MEVNREQLAAVFGVHTRTLSTFMRDGMPSLARGGPRSPWRFDLRECVRWFVESRVAKAGGKSDAPKDARKRLDTARADLAELELSERRAELVEVEVVLAIDADRNMRARKVLESFPDRLAPAFVGETDRAKIAARLREEAHGIAAALERALIPDE